MGKLLIIFLFNLAAFTPVLAQNCSQLKDGKYIIEYDSLFKHHPPRTFEIKNGRYYETENGKKQVFDIVRLNDCAFRLKSKNSVDTTRFTPLQKAILSQQPYYDIYRVENNDYYFVLRVNQHIRSYSGRFVIANSLLN